MKEYTKHMSIGLIGIIIIFLIGVLCFLLFFFAAFGGGNFLVPVPKPEITYGEFPFKLIYELNGETETIEDSIICEFDGFEVVGESGKYRKWKTSLKSGNERITLIDFRDSQIKDYLGRHVLELFFSYGNGEYYMGDKKNVKRVDEDYADYVEYVYQNTDGTTGGSVFLAEEAYELFKIRIISWEVALPIQNNFK